MKPQILTVRSVPLYQQTEQKNVSQLEFHELQFMKLRSYLRNWKLLLWLIRIDFWSGLSSKFTQCLFFCFCKL